MLTLSCRSTYSVKPVHCFSLSLCTGHRRPFQNSPWSPAFPPAPPQLVPPMLFGAFTGVGSEEAPKGWPPSAAQTGRAVFPHPAFTVIPYEMLWKELSISGSQDHIRRTAYSLARFSIRYCAIACSDVNVSVGQSSDQAY
jgi:hypothetical protein